IPCVGRHGLGRVTMSWLSHALILRPRATRSIFVGIIAFSIGAASTAAAVVGFQASDKLFHACANNSGSVRVLAEGDTCKPGEVGFVFPSQPYVDAQAEADKLSLADEAAARKQGDADEAAARKQGDADGLSSAKSYTDTSVGNEASARQ